MSLSFKFKEEAVFPFRINLPGPTILALGMTLIGTFGV
jgi:hypothetical protein